MDVNAYIGALFVIVVLSNGRSVNAVLNVTESVLTATGENNGISIQIVLHGVNNLTCIIDADDDDYVQVTATDVIATLPAQLDGIFTTNGYLDIALYCFSEDEFYSTYEDNFYIGDDITEIDLSNNSSGLAVPIDLPLIEDIVFDVSFLTGTDVNITIEVPHSDWFYQMFSVGNGTHSVVIPMSIFTPPALYTLTATFVNPLQVAGIQKSVILALQAPVSNANAAVLKQYESSIPNPTYVLINQEIEVEMTLTSGDDPTFSLSVTGESDFFVVGSVCTGGMTLHSEQLTLNTTGEYNITIDVTNYVSDYREEINVYVIHAVTGFDVEVPECVFHTDAVEFTINVDTADLPMGSVSCVVDYDDDSDSETADFDMTPYEPSSLTKTQHTFTHTYTARWYATNITCFNQLPEMVNSNPTTMTFLRLVKVLIPVGSIQITHNSDNATHHPFSDPVIFTIALINTGSDLPLANLSCQFNFDTGDNVTVEGDVTSNSNITYEKRFASAGNFTVSAVCSNELSNATIYVEDTLSVYLNCWKNEKYFDSVYQNTSGALTSKTNLDMKIMATVELTDVCNGTFAHHWTIYTFDGTLLENVTTRSATVLNLPKFKMAEGLYKISLSTYFSLLTEADPILTDFVYVKYTLPALEIILSVANSKNEKQQVWRSADVFVDSSSSKDPASTTSVDLTRIWECKKGTAVTEIDLSDFIVNNVFPGNADEDCSDIIGNLGNEAFTIPKNTLVLNVWYLLQLTVQHGATNRTERTAQAIFAIDKDPLDLEFRCQSNCYKGSANVGKLTKFDHQLNVAVNTIGVANNTLLYSWKLKMFNNVSNAYDDKTHLISQSTSKTGFLFSKETMELLGGQMYLISCTVTAPNYAETTISQYYAMNLAPYGGTCTRTPSSGPVKASITELTFTCSGWKDEVDNSERSETDHGGSLQFAVEQQFLNETNGVNSTIPANRHAFKASVRQSFKLLKSPDEKVNMTRVQVLIRDHLGPPYAVFNLGDIEIEPAVLNDASGDQGVADINAVLESNTAAFDSAVELQDPYQISAVVGTLTNCLPTETPREVPIAPEENPDAGGSIIGTNENGERISADDVFNSLAKKEEDVTTTKCKEVTALLADAVLSTARDQSNETKKDLASQNAITRAVTGLAGQKKNLNKQTLVKLKDITGEIFGNTKGTDGSTQESEDMIAAIIRMTGKVSDAMQPEIDGAEADVSLQAERKRSQEEYIFANEETKEAVENGKLSPNEMQYFKMKLGFRKKENVNEMKSLCNNFSQEATAYQKSMIKSVKISDGSVKTIGDNDSYAAMTRDTSEQLANKTLTSSSSKLQIPALLRLGNKKATVAVFEKQAITHLDEEENAGGITSKESTLLIDTEGELGDDTVKLTQRIEKVPKKRIEENTDPEDASQFTYFDVLVKNKFDDLNFNIEPDPDTDVQVEKFNVYILLVENIDSIKSMSVSKATYTAKGEIKGPEWTKKFTPAERGGEKAGVYKVGVEAITADKNETNGATRKKRAATNSTGAAFNFATATMACMTWDDSTNSWRTDECDGTWKPETGELECNCKPKKELTFANSFYVAPNKIDFSSVFLKFSPLNQAAVMATLLLIFLIYIIIIIWARRQDRKDLLKWGITPLSDNFSEDNYFYVIKVFTGMRPGAGTRSQVCMVIAGEEMDSGVRELADGVREEFSTGSVMNFLMSTTVYLGDLEYIRIWHDNSGSGNSASWYLSKIEIHDVQRNESFTFLGERWLAVEKEDGHLECVLPVCKTENLNVFKNRFFLNAKDNLADSHIWISVAYRPQASSFTRTQRASCALLFVMLTMISNAMFFKGSNDENYDTPAELQVGPFRFSLQQIYISFVCALIVTPATLIVIYLFKLAKARVDPNQTLYKPNDRASRYKIPFMNDWLEKEQKRSMELERHLVQKGIPSNQGFALPHWCRRIAWFIVLVTTFLCTFFVMLYSMEWGKQKSEEWITTFLLSFFESVFCLDPVKVGIMAIILALIFRSTKESQAPVNRSTIMKKYSTSLRGRSGGPRLPAPPLDEVKLNKAREERQRDLLMKKAVRDIVVNIIIIWILFSISFSNRDVQSYYMHQEVVNRVLQPVGMPSFSSIKTTTDFFNWLDNTAIINTFPEYEKDGNNTPLHWRVRQFTEGGTLFRVGPPRLRQLRTTKKSCTNSPFPTENCYKKYYEASEETGSYCIGWKDRPCDPDEEIYKYSSDAWRFTSAFDIWGMPISGYYTTYGGGGYIAELSVNRQVSQEILGELFNNSWIDRQSRAVLFEFTLYCLNANIFTYNMFMVEFPETGGAFPYYVIFPMRVYLHQGPLGIYTLACEVLFVLYLIILTVMVIVQIVQQKKAFFKQPWQVYELIFIILSYLAIVMNIVQVVFTEISLGTFREDRKHFVNFYHLALWNTILVLLIGVLVFMSTVRMLNILGYNKRINAMAKVFTKAASDLVWFGLFFSYVFTCYAAFGFLLFGWKLTSYKNIFKTMGTLFISMIGKSRFTEIEETDPVFSKVYFMCFIFFVVYMILTMFLAVLSKAIDQVHEETKNDKTDEMIEYVMRKMKGLMSYGGKTKKATVKPAPWNRKTSACGQKRRAALLSKATNREILQEIRESMQQALTGNPRDFSTPVNEQNRRQVTFRR